VIGPGESRHRGSSHVCSGVMVTRVLPFAMIGVFSRGLALYDNAHLTIQDRLFLLFLLFQTFTATTALSPIDSIAVSG
jgi:hypothetical protein